MSLTPGTRLGVFTITGQIGVGGMGEVYQATDTNLKRQVAIKVLPASVAGDADRLARFQREAEVLAALNHPNIAAIYGLERTGDITALVMELVEGDDLSQRIATGAIPIVEALPIAKQIAEALEAAHEQGIIHRDLKPANIKVRADGTVKVLDFGLAKAMETGAGASPSVTQSPTLTSPAMTQAGMILGTAAYMAPEQARGRIVDKRADIWAFGCVLFEMLTGTRAFTGDDVADVLSRVLQREPDLPSLPGGTPPRVYALIARCLMKDPRQRLRDVGDARLALEGALESAVAPLARMEIGPSRGRLGWIAFAVAAILVAALASPTLQHLREVPAPETRLEVVTPTTDQPASFALSPDGRRIVFVASGGGMSRLWLRPLATTTAQSLSGTEGATYPFWSPDSQSVGFFADGKLKRLNLDGGVPQVVASAVAGRGGSWTADGTIVFAPDADSPLMKVSATGGAVATVTTLGEQQQGHLWPQVLAEGPVVLFYVRGAPETSGIYLGSVERGTPTRLVPAVGAGLYLRGWLLWVRASTIVAQRLDVAHAKLLGEPITVADGVGTVGTFRADISAAQTGLLAYRTSTAALRQLTWVDRSGTSQGTVSDPDVNFLVTPRVSPDGRRVVVGRSVEGNADVWLLDEGRMSRFTFDSAQDNYPIWSPDGARITFRSARKGTGDIYQKLAGGAGAEDSLLGTPLTKVPTSWSTDGRFLLYFTLDPQTAADLWIMPTDGDKTPYIFLKTPFREAFGAFSPDGRWVAYQSNESGRPEVYVRPFVAPGASGTSVAAGGQWQVSTAGGIHPTWRADGRELYYLNPEGAMMAAPISVNGATLVPGAPLMLFRTRIAFGGIDAATNRQYDVASDGRFLINTQLESVAAPITLIQNWDPEAKQ